MEVERQREYEGMRGEYLSLMASLEFDLTLVICEFLEVTHHRTAFEDWFIRAPVPFASKVQLFHMITRENTQLDQFGDIPAKLRDCHAFRNTLAHSFRQFGRTLTSRGREVPQEQVTFEALETNLGQLRDLEKLVSFMLGSLLEGPIVPISADDYADWPPLVWGRRPQGTTNTLVG